MKVVKELEGRASKPLRNVVVRLKKSDDLEQLLADGARSDHGHVL